MIDSDTPILAERSQYWGPEGTRGSWSGGTNAFALPVVPPDYNGCAYNVGPAQFALPGPGGQVTVSVGGTSRCTFTAEPQVSWIRVVSGDSGSGVGQVVLRATPNATAVERTGIVLVAGQPVTIVQAAAPAAGQVRLPVLLRAKGYGGGSGRERTDGQRGHGLAAAWNRRSDRAVLLTLG